MALLIFYNVLWQHSCQSFKLNNKIVNECCCCCFCKLIAGVQVFPLVKWFPYRNLVHRFYHSHSTAATIRLKLKYELFGCCCLLFFQLRNETVNNWQPTQHINSVECERWVINCLCMLCEIAAIQFRHTYGVCCTQRHTHHRIALNDV